jgi:hypothetical protein
VCFRFFMAVLSSFPKIMGVWTRTTGGSVHGDPVTLRYAPVLDQTTSAPHVEAGMVLFGAPAPIEIDKILFSFGAQILWLDRTCQLDRHPDLLKVGRAVGTSSKVRFESASLSR